MKQRGIVDTECLTNKDDRRGWSIAWRRPSGDASTYRDRRSRSRRCTDVSSIDHHASRHHTK